MGDEQRHIAHALVVNVAMEGHEASNDIMVKAVCVSYKPRFIPFAL
jgi:hypothetical protein